MRQKRQRPNIGRKIIQLSPHWSKITGVSQPRSVLGWPNKSTQAGIECSEWLVIALLHAAKVLSETTISESACKPAWFCRKTLFFSSINHIVEPLRKSLIHVLLFCPLVFLKVHRIGNYSARAYHHLQTPSVLRPLQSLSEAPPLRTTALLRVRRTQSETPPVSPPNQLPLHAPTRAQSRRPATTVWVKHQNLQISNNNHTTTSQSLDKKTAASSMYSNIPF